MREGEGSLVPCGLCTCAFPCSSSQGFHSQLSIPWVPPRPLGMAHPSPLVRLPETLSSSSPQPGLWESSSAVAPWCGGWGGQARFSSKGSSEEDWCASSQWCGLAERSLFLDDCGSYAALGSLTLGTPPHTHTPSVAHQCGLRHPS
jgi:hypothetical protein